MRLCRIGSRNKGTWPRRRETRLEKRCVRSRASLIISKPLPTFATVLVIEGHLCDGSYFDGATQR